MYLQSYYFFWTTQLFKFKMLKETNQANSEAALVSIVWHLMMAMVSMMKASSQSQALVASISWYLLITMIMEIVMLMIIMIKDNDDNADADHDEGDNADVDEAFSGCLQQQQAPLGVDNSQPLLIMQQQPNPHQNPLTCFAFSISPLFKTFFGGRNC